MMQSLHHRVDLGIGQQLFDRRRRFNTAHTRHQQVHQDHVGHQFLRQLALALSCPLAELVGDERRAQFERARGEVDAAVRLDPNDPRARAMWLVYRYRHDADFAQTRDALMDKAEGARARYCPRCGDASFIKLEGCDSCLSCGYSKCS